MPVCKCGAAVAAGAQTCSSCGEPLESSSDAATVGTFAGKSAAVSETRRSSTEARFAPGALIGERYRIVAPLGKGGMGEVYRADDLKLGLSVALKFLPREVESDPRLLERFLAEVRNARQVSHPNVCRVYDIGETAGLHFLTMEYIDGEDLASLLRRIGRLPQDKGVEIAHQLCAGLAAAHDVGLLHRDLKPANVMLDGRGRARITDFGLAVAESDDAGRRQFAGTPAYMAPEQKSGAPATVRSDIYSLGLVLFEIFTGKRAFEGNALDAWRGDGNETESRSAGRPRPASAAPPRNSASHASSSIDIDPLVQRAILRCLETDPAKRPASAMQVSAALPGGDPLAAALAAGETPSPEMVAAAGEETAISVRAATVVLAITFALLVALVPLSRRGTFIGLAPSVRPREVLEERAQEIATKAGFTEVADSYGYFAVPLSYAQWRADTDPHGWYRKLDAAVPDVYRYTYRTSPQALFAYNSFDNPTSDDPPLNVPGMTETMLDGRGRLILYAAVPPASDKDLPPPATPDWPAMFAAGGWNAADFKPTEPHSLPNVAFDARAAWDGTVDGIALHFEGASLRGKPVALRLSAPWSGQRVRNGGSSVASQIAFDFLILVMLPVVGGIWARRNLRLGRGDPRGATRLAIVVVSVIAVNTLLAQHWVANFSIVNAVIANAGLALIFAIAVWVAYVAIEPLLRRHAPHLMIAWTRLLAGRFTDGMLGRDVLVGSTAALVIAAVHMFAIALPWWFPVRGYLPYPGTSTLSDAPHFVGGVISQVWVAILMPLTIAFTYAVLRRFVRRAWIAAVVLYAIVWPLSFNSEGLFLQVTVGTIGSLMFVYVFLRFGLLALAVEIFVENLLFYYPPVLRPNDWYFAKPVIVLLMIVALNLYGWRCALAGRPAFGGLMPEE